MADDAGLTAPTLDSILDDFAFIDDWEDRYRYVIELGRTLPAFPDDLRTSANKVEGCVSQVWLDASVATSNGEPSLTYRGDSDALIVKGLIAILFSIYSGQPAQTILNTDALEVFRTLGLEEHLTPQRSNGLRAMVERIRTDAGAVNSAPTQA